MRYHITYTSPVETPPVKGRVAIEVRKVDGVNRPFHCLFKTSKGEEQSKYSDISNAVKDIAEKTDPNDLSLGRKVLYVMGWSHLDIYFQSEADIKINDRLRSKHPQKPDYVLMTSHERDRFLAELERV